MKPVCYAPIVSLLIVSSLSGISAGVAAEATKSKAAAGSLKSALLLHASFDRGLDADFAVGDRTLFNTPTGNRNQQVQPGLPAGDQIVLAKGEGISGDALRFTKKGKALVFFHGEKNLGFRTNHWSGSASLWLRLDPDQDLAPGYCDPLQYVGQAWGEGNMFIEFSKDHTPRHFRYAIMAITRLWNPDNRNWEAIPDKERPMVPVYQPPFRRDQWTHVAFSFGNANTGQKDGWGKLYLNGEYQGTFTGFQNSFNWDLSQSAVTLGLSYVGWLDDLALFDRPLTDAEVKAIHSARKGLAPLLK